MSLPYQLLHSLERNTIKVNRFINFKVSQLPSIYGRVIAGYVFDITAAILILPAYAIGQIVLVTK